MAFIEISFSHTYRSVIIHQKWNCLWDIVMINTSPAHTTYHSNFVEEHFQMSRQLMRNDHELIEEGSGTQIIIKAWPTISKNDKDSHFKQGGQNHLKLNILCVWMSDKFRVNMWRNEKKKEFSVIFYITVKHIQSFKEEASQW